VEINSKVNKMRIGTKSVLFGAHCFLLHPWFVAAAWIKLYGFPFDPRVWISFFVHDLGYLGKPNMDGPEGEAHVLLGAKIMHLFDGWNLEKRYLVDISPMAHLKMLLTGYSKSVWRRNYGAVLYVKYHRSFTWHDFSMYHSRFYAKKNGCNPSRLCMADKLAVALEPSWLYLPRVRWSGEIHEYMKLAGKGKYKGEPNSKYESMNLSVGSQLAWFKSMTSYCSRWAFEHSDGKVDTWTPDVRMAVNQEGVY